MLQGEHSAILSTFIKLPIVIKIFALSIFVWLFNTGFTVPLSTVTSLSLHKYQYQHYCNKNQFTIFSYAAKPVSNGHSKIDNTKIFETNGSLMKVESIAECPLEHSAILLTCIKH